MLEVVANPISLVGCDIQRQKLDCEFMIYSLYEESRVVVACWLWLVLKKILIKQLADEMVWATTKVKPARQRFSLKQIMRLQEWRNVFWLNISEYHFPEGSNDLILLPTTHTIEIKNMSTAHCVTGLSFFVYYYFLNLFHWWFVQSVLGLL